MDAAYVRRVEELFQVAADLPPDRRSAYIQEHAGTDDALRARLEAMLAQLDKQTASSLKSPLISDTPAAGPGERIGPYKLLELIGEGGFGSVYMAQQEQPVRRRVALKIIKLGMDTKQVIARFEAERQALALMDHANIARVFEAGATETGRPYFAMELVRGVPVTEYCDTNTLPTRRRLELFIAVCHAVQHAHTKSIIHRDIKPSNVMVTLYDGEPVPKIIDFGIAKATDQRLTEKTYFTQFKQFIGTPEYMSPEQAEMSGLDVDTRSDVYSLGVLLYELLTGTTPLDPTSLRRADYAEMQRIIKEDEPPKPSARLSTMQSEPRPSGSGSSSLVEIAEHRRTDPSSLCKLMRGDLDWIVMKCLEKDRTRRYETANGLALDITRHLRHEPVLAGPPSATYRLRKFIRRNKLPAAIATAFVVIVFGFAVAMGIQAERNRMLAEQAQNEARNARLAEAEQRRLTQAEAAARGEAETRRAAEEREGKKAEAMLEFMTNAFVSSDPNQGGAQEFLVADTMAKAIELLDSGKLKEQPEIEAALLLTMSRILVGNARSAEALRLARRALELNRELHPDDHPDVARGMNAVAVCLESLGRAAEALPQYQASLEMRQRLFKGDHDDVAASLNNVALCLDNLGRYAEALPKYEAALEMNQRLFQGDRRAVATSLSNLAACLDSLGRPDKALSKFEAASEMYQRLYQGDHPDVATSLNNVAYCLENLDRAGEALPKYEAALDMQRRLFDGDHPLVATGLNNMASSLQSLGRSNEALPYHEEALEIRRRLFPSGHPDVAQSLNNVASCLESLGQPEAALPKYEEALEIIQRLFDNDHPFIAISLSNMASCLQSLGRSSEALPKYEAALEMFRRVLPPGHPHTLCSQIGLARTLVALDRHADAEPLLRDAAEQCERSDASRRLHWRDVLEESVRLYDAWYEAEPDKGYDAKAAEWRAKLPPTELAGYLIKRASKLIEQGRHTEAEALLRECLEIREEVLPEGDWLVFNTMSVLGEALAGQEKFTEAEPLLIESYEKMNPPPAGADRKQEALERIIKLYEAWDAVEPGQGYAEKAAEWRAKLPSGS